MAAIKRHKATAQEPACNHFAITLFSEDLNATDFQASIEFYATDYTFQVERGEETKKRHFQGVIYIKKRCRKTAVLNHLAQSLEEDGVPRTAITVSCLTGGKRSAAMKRYCTKTKTRIEGPFSNKKIYMGADLNCVTETPTQVQKLVLAVLETKADDRTINYFWDTKGNIGKSKLTKYLAYNKMAKTIKVTTADRLASAICQAGAQPAYVVDIPRTVDTTKSITGVFEVLESLKNGHVVNNMYGKDNTLFMASPHVIVFANYPPDKSRMSQDRWKVTNLDIEIGDYDPADNEHKGPTAGGMGGFAAQEVELEDPQQRDFAHQGDWGDFADDRSTQPMTEEASLLTEID